MSEPSIGGGEAAKVQPKSPPPIPPVKTPPTTPGANAPGKVADGKNKAESAKPGALGGQQEAGSNRVSASKAAQPGSSVGGQSAAAAGSILPKPVPPGMAGPSKAAQPGSSVGGQSAAAAGSILPKPVPPGMAGPSKAAQPGSSVGGQSAAAAGSILPKPVPPGMAGPSKAETPRGAGAGKGPAESGSAMPKPVPPGQAKAHGKVESLGGSEPPGGSVASGKAGPPDSAGQGLTVAGSVLPKPAPPGKALPPTSTVARQVPGMAGPPVSASGGGTLGPVAGPATGPAGSIPPGSMLGALANYGMGVVTSAARLIPAAAPPVADPAKEAGQPTALGPALFGAGAAAATITGASGAAQSALLERVPPAEETVRFVIQEAAFGQGAATPPNPATYGRVDALRFGVAAHNKQLAPALDRARKLGLPDAERLVEGVRVNAGTGEVIEINVPPGGDGTLNFDLVGLKKGATLARGDLLQEKAMMTMDAKFGRFSTNEAQAAFAARMGLAHVNVQAGNFRTQVAVAADASELAATEGMVVARQGGFARIGALGIIALATSVGVVLASSDKIGAAINLAKQTAIYIPLGALLTRVAGDAAMGGLLTMIVGLEGDSYRPEDEAFKQRQAMIYDFIYNNVPGALEMTRYTLLGASWLSTSWEYEVKDRKLFDEAYDAVQTVLKDPYQLKHP